MIERVDEVVEPLVALTLDRVLVEQKIGDDVVQLQYSRRSVRNGSVSGRGWRQRFEWTDRRKLLGVRRDGQAWDVDDGEILMRKEWESPSASQYDLGLTQPREAGTHHVMT